MDLIFDNIFVTNLVPDDVLEGEDVDVINADGFDSDPSNDEENNYRKKRLAELRTEMQDVINASGQWKRNLKLFRNDGVRIRSRCDGKVPVFTMSQGTGPTGLNREMEAGPSRSSSPTTRNKKGRIHGVSVNIHLFESIKTGFKACRRDMLSLDGAFMKGPFPSQVLVAVRLDSNNGIYLLAYALVKAESKSSWCWFL
nr:putative transposase, mutator type, MULE transposase domain protein [Tanacetum cinerariifolium]